MDKVNELNRDFLEMLLNTDRILEAEWREVTEMEKARILAENASKFIRKKASKKEHKMSLLAVRSDSVFSEDESVSNYIISSPVDEDGRVIDDKFDFTNFKEETALSDALIKEITSTIPTNFLKLDYDRKEEFLTRSGLSRDGFKYRNNLCFDGRVPEDGIIGYLKYEHVTMVIREGETNSLFKRLFHWIFHRETLPKISDPYITVSIGELGRWSKSTSEVLIKLLLKLKRVF